MHIADKVFEYKNKTEKALNLSKFEVWRGRKWSAHLRARARKVVLEARARRPRDQSSHTPDSPHPSLLVPPPPRPAARAVKCSREG
jgi:hypothetical protein